MEILSVGKNFNNLQNLISKMFECIQKVGFLPKGIIESFYSFDQEELRLRNKIPMNSIVEM